VIVIVIYQYSYWALQISISQNNKSYLSMKLFFICIKLLWYFQTQVAGDYEIIPNYIWLWNRLWANILLAAC